MSETPNTNQPPQRPEGARDDRPQRDDRGPRNDDRSGPRGPRGGGGPGGPRGGRGGRGGPRGRRFRGKVCPFTVEKITYIDWKDIERLQRFLTDRGKIVSRRQSGCTARYQRMLTTAIKRARAMALLPYVSR